MLKSFLFGFVFMLSNNVCSNQRLDTVLDSFFELPEKKLAEIVPLNGGLSSDVFLVVFPDRKVVLRFFDDQIPLSNVLKELWFSVKGAEEGISPKVLQVDLSHRAMLMEYIPCQAFENLELLAETIKKQHREISLEPFATIRQKYETILSAAFPLPYEAELMWEVVDEMREKYSGSNCTFCHNDLHPLNIMFDGSCYKFIDWTSGGLGVAEFDLVKLVSSWPEDSKKIFFKAYYGNPPNEVECERLTDMYKAYLACVFFNRWVHLKNRTERHEYESVKKNITEWRHAPMRSFWECRIDGSMDELYEGSLSALRAFFLLAKKN